MNRSFPNIDKSGFRRGEYVGYARGVWRIRKADYGWQAIHRDGSGALTGRTLAEISAKLSKLRSDDDAR